MQNQSDKTLDKKREEARRALEGEERKKKRVDEEKRIAQKERAAVEEEKRRVDEEKKKKREEEEARKQEKIRKKYVEEMVKRKKRARDESIKKAEEKKKNMQEEERKARKEALFKKILPKGTVRKPTPKKERLKIKRVSQKNAKTYKVSPIRTYKTDINETVQKRKESVVKIALAEKKKVSGKKPIKRSGGKKGMIISVIIFLTIMGSASVYSLNKKNILPNLSELFKEKKTITTKSPELAIAFISPNNERKIILPKEQTEILQIISKEMKGMSGKDSIENIYFSEIVTIKIDEKTEEKERLSNIDTLLSVWSHNMPDILSRSLDDRFMIGIYSLAPGENFPFLILSTNSYEQTFAGMFVWEKDLLTDFYNLFSIKAQSDQIPRFRDKEISGMDTRILISTNNKTKLIYSFINKSTLIITENERVLEKVLSRINR